MKKDSTRRTGYRAALILLMACGLTAQTGQTPQTPQTTQNDAAAKTDLAVIVNPLNPVDAITTAELRKIFVGEKQNWNSSLPVFAIVRTAPARERDFLLGSLLKMTESEYKQYWVKKVYSGEAQREPLAVFSNGMQLEAVRAERGGIALISSADVRQGVKVLKVDGHLPGTAGYTLH
jgi:phosphate transport system substrate-binding protein